MPSKKPGDYLAELGKSIRVNYRYEFAGYDTGWRDNIFDNPDAVKELNALIECYFSDRIAEKFGKTPDYDVNDRNFQRNVKQILKNYHFQDIASRVIAEREHQAVQRAVTEVLGIPRGK